MTVKILDDLCDCRPSVSDRLIEIGLDKDQANDLSQVIHDEISRVQPTEGKEKVREIQIMKKILIKHPLDEEFSSRVIQVIRNAYRDYWYRKKVMQKAIKMRPDQPWQIAANNTLEIYKRTKPSMAELTRATQRIQAAYRGYHVRRKMLDHLKRPKKQAPQIGLGPPVDVAESREIDLGPVLNIKVKEDNIEAMFDKTRVKPSIRYDGPQAPSLLLDEEDDGSHRPMTVDIMSTRTDDNQTLSHYGVVIEDSKSNDDYDNAPGAGGHRISFASKPLMIGASDTSENKDEMGIPELINEVHLESSASSVPSSSAVDDVSEPDDGFTDQLENIILGDEETEDAIYDTQPDTALLDVILPDDGVTADVLTEKLPSGDILTDKVPTIEVALDETLPSEFLPDDKNKTTNDDVGDGNEADDER